MKSFKSILFCQTLFCLLASNYSLSTSTLPRSHLHQAHLMLKEHCLIQNSTLLSRWGKGGIHNPSTRRILPAKLSWGQGTARMKRGGWDAWRCGDISSLSQLCNIMGDVLKAQAKALGWTRKPQELCGCCTEPSAPAAETPRSQSTPVGASSLTHLPDIPPVLQQPQDQVPPQSFVFQLWLSQDKKLDLHPQGLQVAGDVWSLPGFPEAGTKGWALCEIPESPTSCSAPAGKLQSKAKNIIEAGKQLFCTLCRGTVPDCSFSVALALIVPQ